MLNVDYSRRLRSTGNYTTPMKPHSTSTPQLSGFAGGGKLFPLIIGAVLLFTGGMVVGLHLNQTERQYEIQDSSGSEIAFKNQSSVRESKPVAQDSSLNESLSLKNTPTQKPNSLEESPAFFPKNLRYPPQMDQINYVVEIGAYEPGESSRVGKLILQEVPEFEGKIFRTSTGKLYSGYYYRQDEAKKALESLRAFEKDDFTNAEIKTVRF